MDTALAAVLYGLGGAIGWGTSNFFATKASREKNAAYTVFNSQLLLFFLMAIIALVIRPEVNVPLSMVVFIALNYLVFTLGLLISYKAYAIGPVSITSPIVGANPLIVVAVSVIVFNEALKVNQWLGIAILFLGLLIATYERSKKRSKENSSGVLFAFIALIFMGAGLAGFVYAIDQVGWEMAVLLGYFFTAFWAGLYLFAKRQLEALHISRNVAGLVGFQLLGTIAVSVGVEKSLASLVVPVSSVAPLVTSVLGLILFQEKILRYKLIGVGFIILGLVLISI